MKILLTADIHLRGDAPACRKNPDKWLEEQEASFMQLGDIATGHGCRAVWVIGDLFHRARTSIEATVQALRMLSELAHKVPVHILVGNHDESMHQYANVPKSTIGAVFNLQDVHELRSGHWTDCAMAGTADPYESAVRVEAYPFGEEPEQIPSCNIWCVHTLTFPDEESRPLPELGVLAEDLLKRSDAKVIITGDYHHGYVKEFGDRKVITCGCINIQARDMADYKPRVYILDTETFNVEEVPLQLFGELDLDTPMLEDANGYAETLQVAQLPQIDFRDAIDKAAEKAEEDVRNKVGEILETWDNSKIV